MAPALRARASADEAIGASFFLARFASVSSEERVRVFLSRENLIVCRFRLGERTVTVYRVRFPKCGVSSYEDPHFALQSVLHCKSGLREVVGANDAFLALTAQGVWTVPLVDASTRHFLLGPRSACGLPWGGLVAAYALRPGSWELLVDGRGPPVCCVTARAEHLVSSVDKDPILCCVEFLQGQHHSSEYCNAAGSLVFTSESLSRLLGLRPGDIPSQSSGAGRSGTCAVLVGLPDGRVLTVVLHASHSRDPCKPRLVCDLGQPVAAISCWQPGLPENNDNELLVLGTRGKVLSSHNGAWLEAWAPNLLQEAHDLCLDGPLIHWVYRGILWETCLAIEQQSPQEAAFLHVKAGPLPLGKVVSIQRLRASALSKLRPHRSEDNTDGDKSSWDDGLLILDGCGGVRLVSPLPPRQLSLQGLQPHPVVQAKNELLFVQTALQQLRQLRHRGLPVVAERDTRDGCLVATFTDSSGSNWIHVASFDIGDRAICRAATAGPAPGNASRFAEHLGLQVWPAHLEPMGQGVLSLELELPGGHCWPALRAEALLRMLDVLRDNDDARAVPNIQVGEKVEAACQELERLLCSRDVLTAYNAWRSRLGTALPLA
ncbi:uncharacterized protein LOC144098467 isoform X2 [Amblyomma americanum]